MKIAAVSTFRCPCGVAKYYEELAYSLSKLVELKTYAETLHVEKEDSPIYPSDGDICYETDLEYVRNWTRGSPFDNLLEDIKSDSPDIVHIQYESAMYNSTMYDDDKLLQFCKQLKIPLVMTLHNVPQFGTRPYSGWYKKVGAHFIVTNELMRQELLKWEPSVKVTTIPLGSTIFTPTPTMQARRQLGLPELSYYIVQTGFYGYDKGMLPLIEAMPKILKVIPGAKLILAGSVHPLAPQIHKDYLLKCMKTAYSLGLKDKVVFTGKFLSEQDLSLYLSAADLVAINHQFVFGLFSSSASAHRALSCGKPILVNKDDVRLSEFEDGKQCLKMTNENIAEKVFEVYNSQALRESLIKGENEYLYRTSYSKISQEHVKVYEDVIRKN